MRDMTISAGQGTASRPAQAPRIGGGTVVRQLSRGWAGVTAVLTEIRADGPMQAEPIQVDLGGGPACLSAVLEETGGRVEVEAAGRAMPPAAARTPLSLAAAGDRLRLRTVGVRHLVHLVLTFDPLALADLLDEPVDLGAAFRTRPVLSDAPLLALCRLFAGECAEDGGHGRLYGESLAVALVLRLAQLGSAGGEQARTGGLTPWQLRKVMEHIEANYAEEVPLDRLAGLARLSTSHFSRAFKRSAGVSPHQWLLDRRCAKAKAMMIEGGLPLAEIALATGFSDQSHFTRAFGQSNGMPPATWRRAQMGAARPA